MAKSASKNKITTRREVQVYHEDGYTEIVIGANDFPKEIRGAVSFLAREHITNTRALKPFVICISNTRRNGERGKEIAYRIVAPTDIPSAETN